MDYDNVKYVDSGEGCGGGEVEDDDREEEEEDDGDGCGDGELSAIRGSQLPPLPRLHNGTTAPHASNTTRVHFVI